MSVAVDHAARRDLVLDLLRQRGDTGLCLTDVSVEIGYTLRNAISELRARGVSIAVERCVEPTHEHRHRFVRYRLAPDGETPPRPRPATSSVPADMPGQMRLFSR